MSEASKGTILKVDPEPFNFKAYFDDEGNGGYRISTLRPDREPASLLEINIDEIIIETAPWQKEYSKEDRARLSMYFTREYVIKLGDIDLGIRSFRSFWENQAAIKKIWKDDFRGWISFNGTTLCGVKSPNESRVVAMAWNGGRWVYRLIWNFDTRNAVCGP